MNSGHDSIGKYVETKNQKQGCLKTSKQCSAAQRRATRAVGVGVGGDVRLRKAQGSTRNAKRRGAETWELGNAGEPGPRNFGSCLGRVEGERGTGNGLEFPSSPHLESTVPLTDYSAKVWEHFF
jgi:hypothetical protein